MSSLVYYPSLSEDGWVNSSVKVADYLLSDFFLSDFSQSYLYSGEISSLPYVVQSTQGDVLSCLNKLKDTLLKYFGRFFTNVLVEVKDVTKQETPSKVEISLFLSYTDTEGKSYNIGKLLELNNLTINKVISIINTGQ